MSRAGLSVSRIRPLAVLASSSCTSAFQLHVSPGRGPVRHTMTSPKFKSAHAAAAPRLETLATLEPSVPSDPIEKLESSVDGDRLPTPR